MKNKFSIVALTGGIGSGKTLAANYFAELGIPIINADKIALDLAENNYLIKKKIISTFGIDSYKLGNYNKGYIAKIVFQKKYELEKLNKILHPPTISFIKSKIKSIKKDNSPYCIIEAALVVDNPIKKFIDYVVLIDSPLKSRIERLKSERNLSVPEIKMRIKSQLQIIEVKKQSDFIIKNYSSPEKLKNAVETLHEILVKLNSNAK